MIFNDPIFATKKSNIKYTQNYQNTLIYTNISPTVLPKKSCKIVTKSYICDKTPHAQLKSLPKTKIFYTNAVCDVCDNLQVWAKRDGTLKKKNFF